MTKQSSLKFYWSVYVSPAANILTDPSDNLYTTCVADCIEMNHGKCKIRFEIKLQLKEIDRFVETYFINLLESLLLLV